MDSLAIMSTIYRIDLFLIKKGRPAFCPVQFLQWTEIREKCCGRKCCHRVEVRRYKGRQYIRHSRRGAWQRHSEREDRHSLPEEQLRAWMQRIPGVRYKNHLRRDLSLGAKKDDEGFGMCLRTECSG